jgi:hypothetical protein
LDNTAPSDNSTDGGNNRLTGDIDGVDNSTYTDNLTVTLDNLTSSWFTDNVSGVASVSGVYSYFITDNGSRTKDNVSGSSGWTTLDNLTFTIGSAWSSGDTLGNTSLGTKTFYVWAQDNASNVSAAATPVSIIFDNLTPTISSFSIYDSSDDNTSYTNSDNVTFRLVNYDNGTGVAYYFITDNASYSASGSVSAPWQTDNASNSGDGGWKALGSPSDNFTGNFVFDNGTNESKTLYVHIVDTAGQLSTVASQSIVFDNQTPTLSSVADNGSKGFFGADGYLDNMTLVISANDNASPAFENASGFKDFFIRYEAAYFNTTTFEVTRVSQYLTVNDSTIADQTTGWIPFSSLITTGSDNTSRSIAGATYSLDLTSGTLTTGDNASQMDNGTTVSMVVWFRDNASNISGNVTISSFTLDGE